MVSAPRTTDGSDLPLSGTTVVDLTRFVSGSYCTMLLAALGARILKIEVPPGGDSYRGQGATATATGSTLFESINRGKHSVLLDFRTPDGAVALEAMLAEADFFVQNARPGSLDAYGLGYDEVHARHPHLVYASISAFGDTGPEAERGGFDLIVQAESGVMSVTGSAEYGPVKVGPPILDIGAGLSATLAIVAAHTTRQRTGVGSKVSSSLLEFALAGLTTFMADVVANGQQPPLLGSHSPTFSPYGAFAASDGHIVIAGTGSDRLWPLLCDLLDRPDLIDDERYADNAARLRHRDALTAEIETALSRRRVVDWLGIFDAAGLPATTVRSLGEVLASPQVDALDIVRQPTHSSQQGGVDAPFRFDDERPTLSAAPTLGADTRTVLESFGVDPGVIDRLAGPR
ncbi:MAG: CoA transferase [Ilumatobacteraceae bacterium]|uniref:CaiB/BaiF CoA transferase family protein n=1 Tax=Ilumatobacter fluminis TaxID=467091 RepID=UPI002969BDC1|nr:CoA transferase [Ilumatobacteraceae bacterium]